MCACARECVKQVRKGLGKERLTFSDCMPSQGLSNQQAIQADLDRDQEATYDTCL